MEIGGGEIQFLGHDGFLIGLGDKKLVIDPYNISEGAPKADFVLITHSHYDHCSIKDIEKVCREGTIVIVPPNAQSKITRIDGVDMQVIEAGDEIIYKGMKIEAVPAYNRSKEYHPKKEGWLGYVIKFENLIIYHAGDTDKIPEMKKLTGYGKEGNEFVTLLPVSGKYVMDAEEASEVAKMLSPTLAIPMHYGSGVIGELEDAERFVELCGKNGIRAKILERI